MNPIKIMDEIERDEISIFHEGRWQSLRTAIEAQQKKMELMEWQRRQDQKAQEIEAPTEKLAQELAQQLARIARIEQAARNVTECLAGQVPVYLEELEATLNESEPYSLAAVKAEALHKFGDRLFAEQINNPTQDFARLAHDEADRIEREANKCSNPDCRDGWVMPKGVNYWHGTPDMERCPECEAKES